VAVKFINVSVKLVIDIVTKNDGLVLVGYFDILHYILYNIIIHFISYI